MRGQGMHQSRFEIGTRRDGTVEVIVSPAGERSFRIVGFSSETAARSWAAQRTRRAASIAAAEVQGRRDLPRRERRRG